MTTAQKNPESDIKALIAGPAGQYSPKRLAALISPEAGDNLEEMAQRAHALTVQRFGRTIRLYAPLYLSNYCTNNCLYCGFNSKSGIAARRLSIDEACAEADIIAGEGFRDILLVSGEDREFVTVDYLAKLASRLRDRFSFIAVEIYQMTRDEYVRLFEAGIDGVTLYQETYDRDIYAQYHLAGTKADYDRRLAALEDAAAAGVREIGMGVLLGLADWRSETLALAEQAQSLSKKYWQSHISFSFPRLRPANKVDTACFKHILSDKDLTQMVLALRLCFADAGLVLSTREPAHLRDHLVNLGITRMSAGSKTSPGGYSMPNNAVEQFEVCDTRSPAEISAMLKKAGLEAVWKDGLGL